jgi:flavin-dependent dehydrogenase
MQRHPVVIVGAGPAGAATALHLHRIDPGLAAEAIVLEKARHPRPKVCAGGLIPAALGCLRELGIDLEVPHVTVERARVATPRRTLDETDGELCHVIRRDEFDASLVDACRARGISVREEEPVRKVESVSDGIRLTTSRGEIHARMLVAADGSGSIVRRRLFGRGRETIGRAVMCDLPVDEIDWDGFSERRYEFDFREIARGMRGYRWAFPCLIGGRPHVNAGAYTVHPTGAELDRALDRYLVALAPSRAATARRVAFPIRWYGSRSPLAAPHVLLAGDAAGVDPLMGEGISLALEYGEFAARGAAHALATDDFSGAFYRDAVQQSWLGKKLRRLNLATRLFYGPAWPLCFGLAERSRRVRRLGLRWYNGVDEWDRRSGWEALGALVRGLDTVRPTGDRNPIGERAAMH